MDKTSPSAADAVADIGDSGSGQAVVISPADARWAWEVGSVGDAPGPWARLWVIGAISMRLARRPPPSP